MKQARLLFYKAIASSALVTASACQLLPSKYPKVTTVESVSVAVTTVESQPVTSSTTILEVETPAATSTIQVENQTATETTVEAETQPVTSPDGSDNPTGREKNRRVEFIIKTESRKVEISPDADIYQEALKMAMNAAVLTQNVKTLLQWQQVANQWQEAIALMQSVPDTNSNYATAQKKAVEYENNLNYARKNAAI